MTLTQEAKSSGRFTSRQGRIMEVLRDGVAKLPEAERQVIALHCGGELSLAEISSVLDLPRNTVSLRMRSAQERLAQELTEEIDADAASEVNPKMIGKAICSGSQVPSGMLDRIMTRIERFELEAILGALYADEDKNGSSTVS